MRIDVEEMYQDTARSHWIAAQAAGRISDGEPLSSIETEPLEALCDWLRAELIDRDLRDNTTLELF